MDKESRLRPKKQAREESDVSEDSESSNGKKMFICPYKGCGKQFTESGNLKTHIRIHTGERPFVCNYDGCGKSFITKGHLKSHVLTHTGEKPHVCNYCGKKYSRVGRLTIHLRTHTGEKPFVCPYTGCGKSFTEKGNLKTHLRIHTGEKPYQCEHPGCEKRFTTQGHLKDHIRRHNNERPFTCRVCGASFLRASTLKIHNRRHTGERPYKCPYGNCGKAFSESGNLKTHMKIHERGKKRKRGGRLGERSAGKRKKPMTNTVKSPDEPQRKTVVTKETVEPLPETGQKTEPDNVLNQHSEKQKTDIEEKKEAIAPAIIMPLHTGFEKLPLGEAEQVVHSPHGSLFPSQFLSPLNMGASKMGYGSSPQAIKFAPPFSTTNNQAGASVGQPPNSPLQNFGSYMNFSVFANATPCNSLNIPFGSGNCSPCFAGNLSNFSSLVNITNLGNTPNGDVLCKSDERNII